MPVVTVPKVVMLVEPYYGYAPISDNDHETFYEPSNDFPVLPIVKVLYVCSLD